MQEIKNFKIRNILALVIIGGIMGILYLLCFRSMPANNEKLLYMALGLTMGWGNRVYDYFFRTSKTEDDQKEVEQQQIKSSAPSGPQL
jgi:hypothetical protein